MSLLLTLIFQSLIMAALVRYTIHDSDDIPSPEHTRIALMISLGIGVVTAICYAIAHAITGQN